METTNASSALLTPKESGRSWYLSVDTAKENYEKVKSELGELRTSETSTSELKEKFGDYPRLHDRSREITQRA